MHIYAITRGIKKDIDEFIMTLRGKFLPFQYKGQNTLVQFSVRPVQLWEFGFPKEHRDVVMNTMFDGQDPYGRYKKFHKFGAIIRKTLGLNKFPEEYNKDPNMKLPVIKQNIEVIGIGIKDDEDVTTTHEGL